MSNSDFVKSLQVTALDFAAMRGFQRSRPPMLDAVAITAPSMGGYVYENPQVNADPNLGTYTPLNINGASPLVTNSTRNFLFQKEVARSMSAGITMQQNHIKEDIAAGDHRVREMANANKSRQEKHITEISNATAQVRSGLETYKQAALMQRDVANSAQIQSAGVATLDQIPSLKVRI